MEPETKFLIADTFKVTGRGVVLAGCITAGSISTGDAIEFSASGTVFRRQIIGISGIRKIESESMNTGLLIKCETVVEMEDLLHWNPHGVIATIFKTSEIGKTSNAFPKMWMAWLRKVFKRSQVISGC